MGTKTTAVAALGLLLALSGCGGGSAPPSISSPTASETESLKASVMPAIEGKPFKDVSDLLAANGIAYVAIGSDGSKFIGVPASGATVEKADIAAGEPVASNRAVILNIKGTEAEMNAQADGARLAAARAVRYDFNCQKAGIVGATPRTPDQHFHTVQAVWADPDFKAFESCDGDVAGTWWHDKYILEPDEQAIVNQIGADGGDTSAPSLSYSDVLAACILPPKSDWGKTGVDSYQRNIRAVAKAAVRMCPDAPFAAQLQHVASGDPDIQMRDGTYTVGKDIAAGTYQVQTTVGVHNCYWERTGPQGGTIANELITFAPQGPVVTVYAGEGFVSQSCGTWKKID
ncbi:hypothetical protein AB6813_01560 [bacterium RCC_150]